MENQDKELNPLIKMRLIYDNLRISEKKVVDYIEDHPNEIIYMSIGQLAEKCRVSQTSVIRLCKALGYEGFQEMKINAAKYLVAPVKYIHEEIEPGDSASDIIRKVMVADMKAIEDTIKTVDEQEIERAIEALANARKIEFYGVGGSGMVAMDAQHKFFKLGIPCLSYNDPHMQIMSAAMMQENDVVVGISHSGSTKDIIDSLKKAKEAGATTICITSSLKSGVTEVADIRLVVTAKELAYRTEPMASRIAQLAVIDVLSVGVALRREKEVLANLEKARRALISKRF